MRRRSGLGLIDQWLLVLCLPVFVWLLQIYAAVVGWIIDHWIPIVIVIGALLAVGEYYNRKEREAQRASPVKVSSGLAIRVAAIRKEIARTPKLSRYAWSDNPYELIGQWGVYKDKNKTPMRRKTLARKMRKRSAQN